MRSLEEELEFAADTCFEAEDFETANALEAMYLLLYRKIETS